ANDHSRLSRQQGNGVYSGGHRGRGNFRASGSHHAPRKVEVPTTDFDFESANAKFNKQDLVKEAIASASPVGEGSGANGSGGESNGTDVVIPTTSYNKATSFFDNISSESKDREDSN